SGRALLAPRGSKGELPQSAVHSAERNAVHSGDLACRLRLVQIPKLLLCHIERSTGLAATTTTSGSGGLSRHTGLRNRGQTRHDIEQGSMASQRFLIQNAEIQKGLKGDDSRRGRRGRDTVRHDSLLRLITFSETYLVSVPCYLLHFSSLNTTKHTIGS